MMLLLLQTVAILFFVESGDAANWCSWSSWGCYRQDRYARACLTYRSRKCACSAARYGQVGCTGKREQYDESPTWRVRCNNAHYLTCPVLPIDTGSPWCEFGSWSGWTCNSAYTQQIRRADQYCYCQSDYGGKNADCAYSTKNTKTQTRRSECTTRQWCAWRAWTTCYNSKNQCKIETRQRVRFCSCGGTSGNCSKVLYGSTQKQSCNCNNSSSSLFFPNSTMVIGFVALAVLTGFVIIIRIYFFKRSRRRMASGVPAGRVIMPNVNPATAASSLNSAHVSYPRQEIQQPPTYDYNNAGFTPGFMSGPPPAGGVAPPSYDDLFKDQTVPAGDPPGYPVASGAAPYPPPSGAAPYPPQSGAAPYPPPSGAAPYPPQSGAAPYPPPSGAAPYQSQSGAAPYPPLSGAAMPVYPSQPMGEVPSNLSSNAPSAPPDFSNTNTSERF